MNMNRKHQFQIGLAINIFKLLVDSMELRKIELYLNIIAKICSSESDDVLENAERTLKNGEDNN